MPTKNPPVPGSLSNLQSYGKEAVFCCPQCGSEALYLFQIEVEEIKRLGLSINLCPGYGVDECKTYRVERTDSETSVRSLLFDERDLDMYSSIIATVSCQDCGHVSRLTLAFTTAMFVEDWEDFQPRLRAEWVPFDTSAEGGREP